MLTAAYVVALNWACAVLSVRNRRQGVDKHYSTVAVAPQLILLLGYLVGSRLAPDITVGWLFLAIAFLDISLWQIIYLPFFLAFRALGARN